MFDSLVDYLKTNIDELNGHEVQISSEFKEHHNEDCLLYTSPSPRDGTKSRMPSSA